VSLDLLRPTASDGDKVVNAIEISRIPGSNTDILVKDLDTREIHTVTAKEHLPALSAVPETKRPPVGKDGEVTIQGAWICVQWERGGGYWNSTCLVACSVACAGLGGLAGWACAAICNANCWVPSYEICVKWEWSDYPMP
jgi:hypothetical protein